MKRRIHMRKIKRLSALLAAITICAGLFSCSDDAGSSVSIKELNPEEKSAVDNVVSDIVGQDGAKKLDNPKVKWLSFWDINPGDGEKITPDLQLFKDIYGGEIEYVQTTFQTRFDDLATAVIGGDPPDFFSACDPDVFPRFALKKQFAPIDSYVDLSDTLWDDTREMCEKFKLGDDHYVAVVNVAPAAMCVYNQDTIDSYGLKDPRELYDSGKWDWNSFKDLITTYCKQGSDTEKLYGLDSWYYEDALMFTSGTTAVKMENGKVVSNINDKALERVQDFMYDLYTCNAYLPRADFGWTEQPARVASGETLFFVTYDWGLEDLKNFGGSAARLVPMPKDPESDKYYLHVCIDAYAFISGGKNPEGVAAYLNCKKIANSTDEVKEIKRNTLKTEYGWSDEMIEMYDETTKLARANPVYDYVKGCTQDLSELVDQNFRASTTGVRWSETRDSIATAFQAEVDNTNALSSSN